MQLLASVVLHVYSATTSQTWSQSFSTVCAQWYPWLNKSLSVLTGRQDVDGYQPVTRTYLMLQYWMPDYSSQRNSRGVGENEIHQLRLTAYVYIYADGRVNVEYETRNTISATRSSAYERCIKQIRGYNNVEEQQKCNYFRVHFSAHKKTRLLHRPHSAIPTVQNSKMSWNLGVSWCALGIRNMAGTKQRWLH